MVKIKQPKFIGEKKGLPIATASGPAIQKTKRKYKARKPTSKTPKPAREPTPKTPKPARKPRQPKQKVSKPAKKPKTKAPKPAKKPTPKKSKSVKKQIEEQKSDEPGPSKVAGKEVSDLCGKLLVDGRYRFIYDLFKTVKELKSPRFDDELPAVECFFIDFTAKHKEIVQKYLRLHFKDGLIIINEEVGERTDMEAFHICLRKFMEQKPDDYSERGLVNYLSVIAQLGNYFAEKGNCEAWENAFKYAFDLLNSAMEKSKYQDDITESSW